MSRNNLKWNTQVIFAFSAQTMKITKRQRAGKFFEDLVVGLIKYFRLVLEQS